MSADWLQRAMQLVPQEEVVHATSRHLGATAGRLLEEMEIPSPVRLYGVDSGFFYFPITVTLACNPTTDREDLLDLAITIALGHGYFAIMDKLVDEGIVDASSIALGQMMLTEYLSRMDRRYGTLFNVRASHDRYYQEYAVAMVREQRQRQSIRLIGPEDVSILGAKSAPACMPLEAILTAQGWPRPRVESATDAFLAYAGALQLIDDLADMGPDFQDGLSSIPLNLLFGRGLGLTAWPTNADVNPSDIHALAVASRTREVTLRLAVQLLINVLDSPGAADVPPLLELAKHRCAHVNAQLDMLTKA